MTQPTYPGVYIEEVPSGVRTITGVSTSITAFVGRTFKGPADRATRITNFGAFEKQFGGLWRESTLSYSIRQFFQNGGTDAVVVRILNSVGAPSTVTLNNGTAQGIVLREGEPGSGGHTLRVEVTDDGTRHVIVTEIARSPSGAEVVVRRADYAGADPGALSGALAGDTSLVEVAAGTDFANLPVVAGPVNFPAGTAAARAARAPLPITGGNLVITAAANGEDGNNIAVTILPSASNDDFYSIVVERRQNDGTYVVLGAATAQTNASVQAGVGGVPGIGVVVSGNPATLTGTPFATRRVHLAGGNAATPASAQFPVEGLFIAAANEGAWGDRVRLRADRATADPADNALFNLTAELLGDNDQALASESLRNLSVDPESPRFITTILEQTSQLVRAAGIIPAQAPVATATAGVMLSGGNDGGEILANNITGPGMQGNKQGLYQLEDVDLFNLLVIPPLTPGVDVPDPLWADALAYCQGRRAMLIIDSPSTWNQPAQAITGINVMAALRAANSVIYFPRIRAADPLRDNLLATFAPSGLLAGLMARTDAERGVWKAPAGLEAVLRGVRALTYPLIDGEVGQLNPLGINCLQVRPAAGPVAWGARTLLGDDRLASEWKYLPVRRLALMIEESLYRGTQFAVFEPNDRPLWQALRLAVDTFMSNLFRRGAFQGATPDEAYLVKCDDETTTQADIDLGIVNIDVGFAPLKPAEFIFIRIRQLAGQTEA
jgi:phage tail sheath protein FI